MGALFHDFRISNRLIVSFTAFKTKLHVYNEKGNQFVRYIMKDVLLKLKKLLLYCLLIIKLFKLILGETKLICWSTGPTDPILSKNKKIIL